MLMERSLERFLRVIEEQVEHDPVVQDGLFCESHRLNQLTIVF